MCSVTIEIISMGLGWARKFVLNYTFFSSLIHSNKIDRIGSTVGIGNIGK